MSHPGFWSGIATIAIPVLSALAFSYFTGRTIEVGDIKIGAVPQIEDPEMQRCKAVIASVENHVRVFGEVKNALEISMRDTQTKELAAIALWTDMVKSKEDTSSKNSLIDDINHFRYRYSSLENDVSNKLDYIGQVLDYILRGCGLPARE